GIGDDDFVAAVLQQPGHPRGLCPCFDRYARGRARVEPPAKGGGTRGEAPFFDDISLRVELAEMAVLVPEIDADSHGVGGVPAGCHGGPPCWAGRSAGWWWDSSLSHEGRRAFSSHLPRGQATRWSCAVDDHLTVRHPVSVSSLLRLTRM